jgi:hypothetical protein
MPGKKLVRLFLLDLHPHIAHRVRRLGVEMDHFTGKRLCIYECERRASAAISPINAFTKI